MQKPTIKKVKADDLTYDIDVQRNLDMRRVRRMKEDLRLEAIGTLCVSHRDDDTMVVIDGNHRRAALIEANKGDVLVNAEIYKDLSLSDEAALFRFRNTTEKVGYLDRFRVRLIEGEKVAVAVEALAKKHGWGVVHTDEGLPMLMSIKKLEQLFSRDEDVADVTLKVVTQAWSYGGDAVDYRILDGVARFLARYWDDLDEADLINKLATYVGGPSALIAKAQGVRDTFNCPHGSAVAELITEMYNKGKRHGFSRLPSWRS